MKSVHYALNPTNKYLNKITFIICVLTIVGMCCLLTGCLAILPPVFAQQSPEASDIDERFARIADDERQTVLSLLAIVLGGCLWGGLRFYQHAQRIKNPQRMQKMRRKLLVRIAALEDRYARGCRREQAYHRKRENLKQRILDITLRQYT